MLGPGGSRNRTHAGVDSGRRAIGRDSEARQEEVELNSPDQLRRENAMLRERIAKLSTASLRITSSLDLDTVLSEVVESARALTGARYGGIVTGGDPGQPFSFVSSGFTADEHRQLLDWGNGPRLCETIRDLEGTLTLKDLHGYVRSLGFAPHPVVPKTVQATAMRHRGEHVGNFFVAGKEGGRGFTGEDEEVLVLFATQAATAIANARTYREEHRARADLPLAGSRLMCAASPSGLPVLLPSSPSMRASAITPTGADRCPRRSLPYLPSAFPY